jgi:hypothetical protein
MQQRITTFNCETFFGRYRLLDLFIDKRPTGYEPPLQIFDAIALNPGRNEKIKPIEILLLIQSVIIKSNNFFRDNLSFKCKQYKGPGLSSIDGNDLEVGHHCPALVVVSV